MQNKRTQSQSHSFVFFVAFLYTCWLHLATLLLPLQKVNKTIFQKSNAKNAKMEAELNKTEEIVDTTDPNATYITIGGILQGGQVSGLKILFDSVCKNLLWKIDKYIKNSRILYD